MKYNVITKVVKHDLCIGCGVCASICPSKNLKMKWNDYGEYSPFDQGKCVDNCKLCMNVCPFNDENENEDMVAKKLFATMPEMQYTKETGFYLQSFVGYSSNRDIAASGGVASYLLETLLRKGTVDKIICVAPTNGDDSLYSYRVMEKQQEIRHSAGSAYYPVHLASVLEYVSENPAKYAITALPCFAKALRLAFKKKTILEKCVKFIFGLTCGQMKNSFYTRYIASLSGVNGPLRRCFYREKSSDHPSSNFAFTCESSTGERGRIRLHEGVSQVWASRCFTPIACNYCDDIFAELADVSLMDAWLPEYCTDPKGTSLLLVRNHELLSIINESIKGNELALRPIPVSEIIRSQSGVVTIKRHHLTYRLHKSIIAGKKTPMKRVYPSPLRFQFFTRKEIDILDATQHTIRDALLKIQGKEPFPYQEIRIKLMPYFKLYGNLICIKPFLKIPLHVYRKVAHLFKKIVGV